MLSSIHQKWPSFPNLKSSCSSRSSSSSSTLVHPNSTTPISSTLINPAGAGAGAGSGAGAGAGAGSGAGSGAGAGGIKRLVLTQQGRTKLNPSPDREFYAYPRFVTHVDDNFISSLTDVYAQILRPEMEILDLCSSWVSHLPQQVAYNKVVGHGLNAQELARNPRLDCFFVKDLNQDQKLEMHDSSFDAVLCTVSVQYLQQPEKVFAEVFRVLRPGGVMIVSFSNRLFYEKAIAAWRDGTPYSRLQLVLQYFQCVEGFTEPQVIRKVFPNAAAAAAAPQQDNSIFSRIAAGMFAFFSGSSDPFYAVVAYRNFKPLHQ